MYRILSKLEPNSTIGPQVEPLPSTSSIRFVSHWYYNTFRSVCGCSTPEGEAEDRFCSYVDGTLKCEKPRLWCLEEFQIVWILFLFLSYSFFLSYHFPLPIPVSFVSLFCIRQYFVNYQITKSNTSSILYQFTPILPCIPLPDSLPYISFIGNSNAAAYFMRRYMFTESGQGPFDFFGCLEDERQSRSFRRVVWSLDYTILLQVGLWACTGEFPISSRKLAALLPFLLPLRIYASSCLHCTTIRLV